MASLVTIILLAVALGSCSAEMSALEKFLTSGFSTDTPTESEKGKDASPTKDDLVKFMKRTGLIGSNNQISEQQKLISALQALNQKQAAYYSPQVAEQSRLTNYVAPKRQLTVPQQELSPEQRKQSQQLQQQLQQWQLQRLQQLQQQNQQHQQQQLQLQQQQQPAAHSSSLYSAPNAQPQNSEVSESNVANTKTLSKADRQGYYDSTAYDTGYSGGHDGYISAGNGFAEHQDAYGGGHHYEPHKEVYVPKPALNINFDPLGLLRLLLAGIPRPLLNLNGKVFFGVELGKHAGIGVGKTTGGYHHPSPGYGGGKGVVLNLG